MRYRQLNSTHVGPIQYCLCYFSLSTWLERPLLMLSRNAIASPVKQADIFDFSAKKCSQNWMVAIKIWHLHISYHLIGFANGCGGTVTQYLHPNILELKISRCVITGPKSLRLTQTHWDRLLMPLTRSWTDWTKKDVTSTVSLDAYRNYTSLPDAYSISVSLTWL